MQHSPEDRTRAARREFLKGLAVAGGVASIGAGAAGAASAEVEPESSAGLDRNDPIGPSKSPGGYRETDHIRAYYESTGS